MDDDGLRSSDRVLRAVLGAVIGGGTGLLVMVDAYSRPSASAGRPLDVWLVPVIVVSAGIGAVLGYRSRM